MDRKPPTDAKINQTNREFWEKRQEIVERQLADDAVRMHAFAELEQDQQRGVPVPYQRTVEDALQRAEDLKAAVISQRLRRAASAPRPDRLQALIVEIVEKSPTITCPALLERLRQCAGDGVVEEIDDDEIWFVDGKGKGEHTPISGLKDRLTRAKKKVRSR